MQKTVKTQSGVVRGKIMASEGREVSAFLGIPYAAPPVGDLRWRPPQAHEGWTAERDCTDFGDWCTQPDMLPESMGYHPFGRLPVMSEDCLTLNVWTPKAKRGTKLPVMVYIHGGMYLTGSPASWIWQGQNLAVRDMVVVTIQYRLGIFGFMAHPDLSRESPTNTSGNYGLMDQLFALEWVRDNIAAFGGDPDNVTLMGHSAGGHSTALLMSSPKSQGLFHRACIQSANIFKTLRHLKKSYYGKESGEEMGLRIASNLGVGAQAPVDTLRGMDAETLLKRVPARLGLGSEEGELFEPVVDGELLPFEITEALTNGTINKVPVIVGFTRDEASPFTRGASYWGAYGQYFPEKFTSIKAYDEFLTSTFGGFAPALRDVFPISNDDEAEQAVADIISTVAYIAPARRFARGMAALGQDTYLYRFNRGFQTGNRVHLGAYHMIDAPFVFSTVRDGCEMKHKNVLNGSEYVYGFEPDVDYEIGDHVSKLWENFIKFGDPNEKDPVTTWDKWDPTQERILELGEDIAPATFPDTETCNVFDELAKKLATFRDKV